MAEEHGDPAIETRAFWDLNSYDVPMQANQIVLQPGINDEAGAAQGVYLHLGHVMPPAFPETPQGAPIQEVPVVVLGSYFLTPQTLKQLGNAVNNALEQIEKEQKRRWE